MYDRVLGLLIALCLCAHASAQKNTLLRLQKRYGYAYAWGSGYVVQVNGYYAFADLGGDLSGPFRYRKLDTVFLDRAIACTDPYGNNCTLVNETGRPVSEGSYRPLRLVNRKKRMFAMGLGDDGELLMDDMGRQITYQTSKWNADRNTLVRIGGYDRGIGTGLMTLNGDTLLPPIYKTVSMGAQLYASVLGDTAYVYQRGKGLLFKLGKVHDLTVLPNDMIVATKYGSHALVSRSGKLLTEFKYYEIKSFDYPYTIMPRSRTGKQAPPPPVPNYALITGGQPQGLIDATGTEVLPIAYDHIYMNKNGWFVLRKTLHDDEQLTDNKFNKILEAGAFDIQFINERYVSVRKSDRNSDDIQMRTYDMVLRKFVNKTVNVPLDTTLDNIRMYARDVPDITTSYYNPDSMFINVAGTKLLRRHGHWGVVSATGDTILPFTYDTAGTYGYRNYFVGNNNRFAQLSYEGTLATPAELPDLPWMRAGDSIVFTAGKVPYSYKGWHVRKMDPAKEDVHSPWVPTTYGGMAMTGGENGYKYGLYNKHMQLLAEHTFGNVQRTGIVAITDSARRNITIIDSTGRRLFPWAPMPRHFNIYDSWALLVYDTGKADILYRIDSGIAQADTVYIDKQRKLNWRGNEMISENIYFDKPGYGKGVLLERTGHAFLVAGAQQINADDNYTVKMKVNGKWGIYDNNGKVILPFIYDSISHGDDYCELVYLNGKVGVFRQWSHDVLAAAYDHIEYTGSLSQGFLIAYNGGKAVFFDEKGRPFATGWDDVPRLRYSMLGGIPATRNGIKYRLYPTLADTLAGIPDTDLPEGSQLVRADMDGTMILKKGGYEGVYDNGAKRWLVPAKYTTVRKEEDYFAAFTEKPNSVTMYTPDGKSMFSMKGQYDPQREFENHQWFMHDWNSAPVVNDAGRIIVPDTFTYVSEIIYEKRRLYEARTKGGKTAIIDTNGTVLVAAIFDYVSESSWMYGGYFLASIDGKECLLSPRGRQLTKCIYESIFPGFVEEEVRDNFMHRIHIRSLNERDPKDLHPYFIVSLDDTAHFGVVDSNGHQLVPCVYDSIRQVHLGKLAVAKKNGKWGLVGLNGKQLTAFRYDSIGIFYGGTANFNREGITGVLRDDGHEEVSPGGKQ